ncbi:uncharacterized protein CC84DRAFT_1232440 [Paraphaeosphaeria sporulosa]|uniref:Uncharacterized protein n=1 Tax=Paraphaeosphaeria sporulosa TaxID=1460663 RepID=A0A177BZI4_9PLEO|nr:uncharacterized protein CC84DRAFT_1232440 [Paraphaeosphaeria sporulosa]OAF99846.1 hypothetical protein CC84DRAFT_1232440 [Paraphaeosphaeria sporulosa]
MARYGRSTEASTTPPRTSPPHWSTLDVNVDSPYARSTYAAGSSPVPLEYSHHYSTPLHPSPSGYTQTEITSDVELADETTTNVGLEGLVHSMPHVRTVGQYLSFREESPQMPSRSGDSQANPITIDVETDAPSLARHAVNRTLQAGMSLNEGIRAVRSPRAPPSISTPSPPPPPARRLGHWRHPVERTVRGLPNRTRPSTGHAKARRIDHHKCNICNKWCTSSKRLRSRRKTKKHRKDDAETDTAASGPKRLRGTKDTVVRVPGQRGVAVVKSSRDRQDDGSGVYEQASQPEASSAGSAARDVAAICAAKVVTEEPYPARATIGVTGGTNTVLRRTSNDSNAVTRAVCSSQEVIDVEADTPVTFVPNARCPITGTFPEHPRQLACGHVVDGEAMHDYCQVHRDQYKKCMCTPQRRRRRRRRKGLLSRVSKTPLTEPGDESEGTTMDMSWRKLAYPWPRCPEIGCSTVSDSVPWNGRRMPLTCPAQWVLDYQTFPMSKHEVQVLRERYELQEQARANRRERGRERETIALE